MTAHRLSKKLHRLAYFGSVLACFLLGWPFLWLFARNPRKYYRQIVFLRKWISLAGMYGVGIRLKVEIEQPIDWRRQYVICPNHTSILDITAVNGLCPVPFSFMGKIELLKNPVTRIFFRTVDIPVDRGNRVSAFRAFERAKSLLGEGRSVAIFPEGKIDDGFPPRLHPFKSGAFRLATETGTAILPVVIQDAWKILWDDGRKFGSRPGVIHVKVLAPIETDNLDTAAFEMLEEKVYDRMKRAWEVRN